MWPQLWFSVRGSKQEYRFSVHRHRTVLWALGSLEKYKNCKNSLWEKTTTIHNTVYLVK